MTKIRYSLHFLILLAALIVFWLAKDVRLPYWIFNFNFFHFGLMGALHATCIVVSLRNWKAVRPIVALCFIILVTVWSAATPILALWSGYLWDPLLERLPQSDYYVFIPYLIGSAIGSSGYWLLVRLFWVKSLQWTDWLRTMALCVAATFVSMGTFIKLDPNDEIGDVLLTAAWWFAFSLSIYWSEARGRAIEPSKAVEAGP
jgi:hypothetical protein